MEISSRRAVHDRRHGRNAPDRAITERREFEIRTPRRAACAEKRVCQADP
jgi:hypothetical protein